jgi:NAD(P)-dependent dehydrogenase (short-subunit alcohol dehydrogenase family)
MLGAAGATVYCTGRGSKDQPSSTGYCAGRPETIEETARMVEAAGGVGIPARVDHGVAAEVADLIARVEREQGYLDVLVNVFWGGPAVTQWGRFWTHSLDDGRALFSAAWPHVVSCRYAAELMVKRRSGLVVQLTEGDALFYRQNVFYDLGRIAEIRLAYALAEELAPRGITVLALTPGYLRSESTLDLFGVTEANWREAVKKDPNFIASETPCFVGRAVAALASDPRVHEKSGGLYSSWGLAREYGFADMNGSQPNWAEQFKESPWPRRTGFQWTLLCSPKLAPTGRRRRTRAKKN